MAATETAPGYFQAATGTGTGTGTGTTDAAAAPPPARRPSGSGPAGHRNSVPTTVLEKAAAGITVFGGPPRPDAFTSASWAAWINAYSAAGWNATTTTNAFPPPTAQESRRQPAAQASLDLLLTRGYFQPPPGDSLPRRERCQALRRFCLTTADERPTLQRYSALAQAVFHADFAAVFMSNVKTPSEMFVFTGSGGQPDSFSVPIRNTICGHAMLLADKVLVIPNIKKEWAFSGLPCTNPGGFPNTADGQGLLFYASAPIRVNPNGPTCMKTSTKASKTVMVGRLCILGREPRHDWTETNSELLASIAGMCGDALENDYLQSRAVKVSEMQRAISSLTRTLDEDRGEQEDKSTAGLAAAVSAANARDGHLRICPRRVEQACKHLREALHADSVTAVDLSTFKVSTLQERRSASGTAYPLTPWLPTPSPSLSFHSSSARTTESDSSNEGGQAEGGGGGERGGGGGGGGRMPPTAATTPGGMSNLQLNPGAPTSTSMASSAGFNSFWHSHQQLPSSSSRTSVTAASTTDSPYTSKQQHQPQPPQPQQHQQQQQSRPQRQQICAQMCDTETPKVVCHYGAPELAPQLHGIMQKKALSAWLTRWIRDRNPIRPQLYRQRQWDEDADADADSDVGDAGDVGEAEGEGEGEGEGGAEQARTSGLPDMGGDSSLAMLGGQQLGSPLVAPGRPRVGPSRSHGHSNSSTGSLFDGMMGPNGGGGPNGGNGGGGGGGNDEYDDDSDDAVTNPLGLHLPNAKQYAALPIFPLSKGNPVVLIVATFLDEVAVEESELLFFESVGAVLYSSLLTQQARAVDRAQLSLIRGLQHEFRTPLHGILGIVDAIQSHEEHGDPLITSDPALFHNLLESIRLASSSLNGLLDDVLTFGEIAGVQTSAKQASKNAKASAVDDIDLGDLIEEVALEELYVRKLSINQSETIRNATSNSDSGSSHGDHDDEGGGSAAIASSSSAAAAAVEPARMADLQLQNGIASLSLSAPSDDEAAATAPAVAQDMHRNASAGAQSNGTSGEASDEAGEGEGEDGTCARTVRQGSSSRTSIRDREPDLPPELVMDTLDLQDRFRCDRTKVQKALRKIVNNALRFTSRGVVKITARQRAEANRNKQVVVDFEISDTGPGMSQEFITNKLMEPFVKGSAFDSGVGLGNVIAASLVSQMGGSMHVASELGKGTTVTISLPLTPLGPNRMMMHQGGYACHAVLFVGCENVGINAGVEFLRSMLRSKGVLPVEEIGGLPDLLVISERVLNATYNKESWEGSGLDQSDKKTLLFLQPNARVIVVSRGERGMDRINLGPMGARPIHVLMMPYGPSRLRALHAFLQVQQEKPFALRPLVIPGGGGGAVGGGSLSPSSAVGKKATRPAVRPGMAARRGEALSKRSESAGAGGEEGGGVSSAVDDGAPAQTEASDVSEGEMKAAAEEAVAAAAAVAEGEEAENTGEPQPRPSAGLTRSESEDKTRLAEEVVHQMAQAAAKKADDDEFRVLVVEDNPINLKLLTTLCRRLKFKYEEAKDGVEAVVKYISFRPSVVLLDISLPEQDGFEAAAQMRSHPPFSEHHPRIVAITALSSEQDKIRGLTQCGMDVWLTKPVSTRALHKDLVEMEQVWRAARAGDGGVGQQGQGQQQQEQPQQQGQEQPQQ